MTAASREYSESGWKEDCLQVLARILRKDADYDSMNNPEAREEMRKKLSVHAADWCKRRGMPFNWKEVGSIADKAISRYLSNWEDKTPGEDDRAKSLGRINTKKNTDYALQTEYNLV